MGRLVPTVVTKQDRPNRIPRPLIVLVARPSIKPNRHFPASEGRMVSKSHSRPTKQSVPTQTCTKVKESGLVKTTAAARSPSSSKTPTQEENSAPQRITGSCLRRGVTATIPVVKPRRVGRKRLEGEYCRERASLAVLSTTKSKAGGLKGHFLALKSALRLLKSLFS